MNPVLEVRRINLALPSYSGGKVIVLGSSCRACDMAEPMKSCENRIKSFGFGAWIAGTALLLSSGCSTYSGVAGAIDWPIPYTASAPHASNGRSVAISVVDERPYVLSGDKKETFIGFIRSAAGISYNTTFEPAEAVAKSATSSRS